MNELGSELFRTFFRSKKYFKTKKLCNFKNCHGSGFFLETNDERAKNPEQVAENRELLDARSKVVHRRLFDAKHTLENLKVVIFPAA